MDAALSPKTSRDTPRNVTSRHVVQAKRINPEMLEHALVLTKKLRAIKSAGAEGQVAWSLVFELVDAPGDNAVNALREKMAWDEGEVEKERLKAEEMSRAEKKKAEEEAAAKKKEQESAAKKKQAEEAKVGATRPPPSPASVIHSALPSALPSLLPRPDPPAPHPKPHQPRKRAAPPDPLVQQHAAKKSQQALIPCVGDWKCYRCGFWNSKFFYDCYGTLPSGESCDQGVNPELHQTQLAAGGIKERKSGAKWRGDWMCRCQTWNRTHWKNCANFKCDGINEAGGSWQYTDNNGALPIKPNRPGDRSVYGGPTQHETAKYKGVAGRYKERKKPYASKGWKRQD